MGAWIAAAGAELAASVTGARNAAGSSSSAAGLGNDPVVPSTRVPKNGLGWCAWRLPIDASLAAERVAEAMDRPDKAWSPRVIPESGSQVGDKTGKRGLGNKGAGPEHTVNLRLGERARLALDEKTQKLERLRLDRERSVPPKHLATFLVQPEIPKRPRHTPSGLGRS